MRFDLAPSEKGGITEDMLKVIFSALQEAPYRYANPVLQELTRQINQPEKKDDPPSPHE